MNGFNERSVTWASMATGFCWLAGLALAVANVFVSMRIGAIAVGFFAAAGVLSLRCSMHRYMADWTAAYELGKETIIRRVR